MSLMMDVVNTIGHTFQLLEMRISAKDLRFQIRSGNKALKKSVKV